MKSKQISFRSSLNLDVPPVAEGSGWRQTLDHFDAIKIGLTATPAAHTKRCGPPRIPQYIAK